MQTLAANPSQERPVRSSRKSINYNEALLSKQRDSDSSDDEEETGNGQEEEEDDEEEAEEDMNRAPEGNPPSAQTHPQHSPVLTSHKCTIVSLCSVKPSIPAKYRFTPP